MAALAAEELALLGSRGLRYLPRMTRALRAAGRLTTRSMRYGGRALSRAGRTVRRNPITSGLMAAQAGELARSRMKRRKISAPLRRPAPRKAVRPPKRTVFARRGMHAASVSAPFRKSKRPNYSARMIARHYDDYGTISRNHSLWAGFQTHGSRGRMMQIASEALLRALLTRIDHQVSVFDEVFPDNGTIQKLTLKWVFSSTTSANMNNVVKEYTLGGKTFEAVAAEIKDDWFATDGDTYQGCPTEAVWYRSDWVDNAGTRVDRAVREINDVDRMKLIVYAKQKVRIQNASPNDAGTDTLDVNGTNPVQGKIYEFTTPPKLREKVAEIHTGLRGFQTHEDGDGVLYLGNITETGVDGVIGHPPPAGGLFTNCQGVSNVSIAAGGQKFKTTLFKFEGNLEKFSQMFRTYENAGVSEPAGYSYKKHGGGVFWLGLEQAFRQGSDVVKVGFNRELSMSARCQFASKRPMLKHYEQTDLGDAL